MAGRGGDDAEVQRAAAASRALKRLFPKLVAGIPPDAICDTLYSIGVINREELEIATNEQHTRKKRTRPLILALQKAVRNDHTLFDTFCTILESEEDVGLSEIAKLLRGGCNRFFHACGFVSRSRITLVILGKSFCETYFK